MTSAAVDGRFGTESGFAADSNPMPKVQRQGQRLGSFLPK